MINTHYDYSSILAKCAVQLAKQTEINLRLFWKSLKALAGKQ